MRALCKSKPDFSNADRRVCNIFGTFYYLNNAYFVNLTCRKPLRSEHIVDSTTLAINLGVSIPICLLCILAVSVIGLSEYRLITVH